MTRRILAALIILLIGTLSSACSMLHSSASASSSAGNHTHARADVHTALALAYLDQGQTEAGRIEALRALAWVPEHRDALHALALAALAQGHLKAARGYFKQAMHAEGSMHDAGLKLNYARFLCEHHDASAGRVLLKSVLEQSPENALRIQPLLNKNCSK